MAGLFAGIGGIELGMAASGHSADLLCEIDDAAYAVLRRRFPADIPLIRDVRDIDRLPPVDLIAAGFPCQDLSQAGRTAGITGERSGLVGQVLRLVEDCASARWLLLENVPFMLQLDRGEAMRFLTTSLDALGFQWAYRIVDTRAFGLPQRRQRVLLLASRDVDPKEILFPDDAGVPAPEDPTDVACGFYWTEGVRGLGWAVNAVPTLKGGSTIGIPSPPAIWTAEGDFVLPEIRDVERLQGFPADWTAPAVRDERRRSSGPRWKLVGNAVSVPVAEWLGHCLLDPRPYDSADDVPLERGDKWPTAAWGTGGEAWRADVSPWPKHQTRAPLSEFLEYPTTSLSARATAGFLSRARRGNLRFPDEFLDDLERHLARVSTVTPVG
jgi:DNA (cytosine-5)-methyltransferase 1